MFAALCLIAAVSFAAEPQKLPTKTLADRQFIDSIKQVIEDETGEPDSIRWMSMTRLGKHGWGGAQRESDNPVTPIVVKYRVKNALGNMVVTQQAVLFNQAGKIVGITSYPIDNLYDYATANEGFDSLFGKNFVPLFAPGKRVFGPGNVPLK